MKPFALKLAAVTLLMAGVFSVYQLVGGGTSSQEPAFTSLGDVQTLVTAYGRWKAARSGAQSDVVLPLTYSKGLSAKFTKARGKASLDLIGGSVSVEVSGLPDRGAYDVWLIDNHPGPARSVKPEPGDARVRVGTLTHDGAIATLQAQLDRKAIVGFEVDLVAVAPSGAAPGEAGLLFGAPSLFQRLYHGEQRGQFARVGLAEAPGARDSADRGPLSTPFSLLIASPAYAQDRRGQSDFGSHLRSLISKGENIFFNETFKGNGRTCGTCHPAENNFTIDPPFIATLPPDNPLFVAERIPALDAKRNGGKQFEVPVLMRRLGLILENVDGFENLETKFVMRGVPHVLAMSSSIAPPTIPFDNSTTGGIDPPAQRTGWSGDGAFGGGTLREFAIGAVIQHFPLTTNRVRNVDFRFPTDFELTALEAFQLSLGRQGDLETSKIIFKNPKVTLGLVLFNRLDTNGGSVSAGKCALCHDNAGANINEPFFSALFRAPVRGNANFGTAVNELPGLPADLIAPDRNPRDGGFGRVDHNPSAGNCDTTRKEGFGFGTVTPPGGVLPPGLCEEDFNTPPLVEAADTGPFFHNNAVDTIEAAVAFYNDDAFNNSAGGQLAAALDSGGVGIRLASTEVTAISAFLRVINALENIRSSTELLKRAASARGRAARRLLVLASAEAKDGIEVLRGANLHPEAVARLQKARVRIKEASGVRFLRGFQIGKAIADLQAARAHMVETSG